MENISLVTSNIIQWIRDWFEECGKGCNAVIGMSGGKDSTIVAALCALAIGKDRVIGVAMPDKGQSDNDAEKICEYLGIRYICQPISLLTNALSLIKETTNNPMLSWSEQAEQNFPPRLRMIILRGIAQTNNGRYINTCNLSEDYIGYFTISGDGDGDMSPLHDFTVTEILEIGDYLGLPKEWVHKTPDDGLPHSCSDEEKFGFSYATLDNYIRGDKEVPSDIAKKIKEMHDKNEFKLKPMAHFEYEVH